MWKEVAAAGSQVELRLRQGAGMINLLDVTSGLIGRKPGPTEPIIMKSGRCIDKSTSPPFVPGTYSEAHKIGTSIAQYSTVTDTSMTWSS